MGNEKSRNHDTKGGDGGASKHQGKPKDQDGAGTKAAEGGKDNGAKGGEPKGESASEG